MMRFMMVAGDVSAANKGEPALALLPEAIFFADPHAPHTTWVRLTEAQIRQRLQSNRAPGDIIHEELLRALDGIAGHVAWQHDVMKRRGYWRAERKHQKVQAQAKINAAVLASEPPTHSAVKESRHGKNPETGSQGTGQGGAGDA